MAAGNQAELNSALEKLGHFVSDFIPGEELLAAAIDTLLDTFAVTMAGSALAESAQLRKLYPPSSGNSTVFASGRLYSVADASWLNGISLVSLELDEGNKSIRGHASAHVFPVVLALAEELDVSGRDFVEAFLIGHEVASRFGNATVLRAGLHPHGNWGTTGAAAGCARLLRLDPRRSARAIDNATSALAATPFSAATSGMAIRNSWIGSANVQGLWASTVAKAEEDTTAFGLALETLGSVLGNLDATALASELGSRFFLQTGYFKRHASCSYTHPPVDAALELRGSLTLEDLHRIEIVRVQTNHLASDLVSLSWPTRLAAMFSIPYAVATALEAGSLDPSQFERGFRESQSRISLANRVEVTLDEELDSRLPKQRSARVTIEFADGSSRSTLCANPIGDADNQPFDREALAAKASALIGEETSRTLLARLGGLVEAPSMREWAADLRKFWSQRSSYETRVIRR